MTIKAIPVAKTSSEKSANGNVERILMPIERKRALASGLSADEAEVVRVMKICNTCRYCESFCAVFPAMTRRIEFRKADVHHLANLCHNCSACLHACYYAPPDDLGVNVPQAMARVRLQTYTDYAWPAPLGALYQRNGLTLSAALAAGLALFLLLAIARNGTSGDTIGGSFYAIFPHDLLLVMFGPVFLFATLALGVGVRRFWRDAAAGPASGAAVGEAVRDALRLKHLDGGHGEGCNDADDAFTKSRRAFHHLTFYGFLACFAATAVATLYHYVFDWPAPYGIASLPKLLGIAGGVALVVGTSGLFALNLRRHPLQQDPAQRPMDRGFIMLLFLVAASGLGLMLAKQSNALPLALCVHLGSVMALFATLPYGKFAHGVYRSAALLKWAIERRQPNRINLTRN